jgi:uncharacterized protein
MIAFCDKSLAYTKGLEVTSWISRVADPTASPGDGARRYTECMHALIESHREQLLSLARRRGVTSVRVFGSMVREEEREDSDVDLLVTLAPGTSALALGGLLLDAQELLGRRVDVVTEASLHPALRDRVLADAVPL